MGKIVKNIAFWSSPIWIVAGMIYGLSVYDNMKFSWNENKQIQTFTATQLAQAFDKNELYAGESYRGTSARVTGIYKTSGYALGAPWIILSGQNSTRGAKGVQCFLRKSSVTAGANLALGSSVRVVGEVGSFVFGLVALTECDVESSSPP